MAFTHRTINEGNRLTSEKAVHKSAIGTNGARMSIVGADDTVSPHIAHRRAFLQEFIDTGTGDRSTSGRTSSTTVSSAR